MKRLLITIFFISFTIGLFGQNANINRLNSRLRSATNDYDRALILDSLSMYNMFFYHNEDSTFYYCNEYLNKAFKLPDKKYLILAYARLSFYYNNTGQYKESLSTALTGLDLSEQYHIEDYLSAIYYDLTWAYNNLGENAEGLKSVLKGIAYLKQNKDPFFDQALHLYGIAGSCYVINGKPDSALYYYKKMDSAEEISRERGAKAISDWYWGTYYLYTARQYQKADSVLADGIKECQKTGEFLLNYFYVFSSQSNINQHRFKLAIAQAREATRLSVPLNDIACLQNAANLLNECYEKLGKPDSAYRYLKMKDSLNDVMQTHSNALDIQQSRFDQQLNQKEKAATNEIQAQKSRTRALVYVFVTGLVFLLVILIIQLRNSKQKRKANEVLRQQKEKVENTLTELKSTQAQLVQREKMASLGELTAGIAHEIQNPLNFVNNFSDVNREMLSELEEELNKGDIEEAKAIAADIRQNSEKINHHGKRAEGIVKGMLEHSRASTGQKEPTDINALADEYMRLAYHGLRAKDKSFTSELVTDLSKTLPKVNVIPQDMGRVLLNLFNNAFYAVNQKTKTAGPDYKPIVELSTAKNNGHIEINVKDNGIGIPDAVKNKIMQPFFTTKPTGQGTGLGLSLAYDIVAKEHSGAIDVTSQEGEGSVFKIRLPIG
ncbi:MAG TPA: ATP-binding protein [Mucilaginibacter sp.]|jgi:signal transduction histidine kinase|nr:ATP-binding protein [Mucilaginibacter sp.]